GNVPCKSPGEGCPESKQDDEADGKFEGEPVAHPGCAAVGPEHRCLVHFNEIVQALMKTLEFLMARRSRRAAIQFAKNLLPPLLDIAHERLFSGFGAVGQLGV